MKSSYRTIEELVERIDERNSDNEADVLLGVSIEKCFIPSVANTIGTDLTKYKLIRKNDFAVSLMQVSRDSRIPIARQTEYEAAMMSPAYSIFRVKNSDEILPEYLEMWFKRGEFDREAAFIAVGGVRGSMPWDEFAQMKVRVPKIEEQRRIVKAYKAITDRIELKRRINENLEIQMLTLFKELILNNEKLTVDEPLDSNISFINGLAMQNFRPNENETSIPVIKIRELSQGFCDEKSECCTDKIDNSHEINNGDLIFSWSGSLQVTFWTSGKAGLNQHLFKVASKVYPDWYVFLWIKHHLLNFQRIAENKGTTFGHIKREDLHSAKIKTVEEWFKFNRIFSPILTDMLINSTEGHKLMGIQRILLAQLSH